MVNIINGNRKEFFETISTRNLFLFGAGKRAGYILEMYNCSPYVKAIIDNNTEIQNTMYTYNDKKIPIISIKSFVEEIKRTGIENTVVAITVRWKVMPIIEQLDSIQELQGLRCYVMVLLDNYYEKKPFDFTVGKVIKIPKKIHYCWFGGKEIPKHLQKYMDSWRKYCPDYEIIRWDESNYDVSKNRYMREAYECGKWGFVPDYARLDIIYNEGGIYLDTDVELLAPLDRLLYDEMYCGFNCYGLVNLGNGFGAAIGNELIKKMRDYYDNVSFYCADGSENTAACNVYQHPVLRKYGFMIETDQYQKIGGAVIYPSEVLAPTGASGIFDYRSEKTVSIHHAEVSWLLPDDREAFQQFREKLTERILAQNA